MKNNELEALRARNQQVLTQVKSEHERELSEKTATLRTQIGNMQANLEQIQQKCSEQASKARVLEEEVHRHKERAEGFKATAERVQSNTQMVTQKL